MSVNLRKYIILSLLLPFCAVFTGCGGGGGSTSDCSFCIGISTTVTVNAMKNPDPGVFVNGQLGVAPINIGSDCDKHSSGATTVFDTTTDSNGAASESNIAMGTACTWNFFRGTSAQCPVQSTKQMTITTPGQSIQLPCGVDVNTFLATPNKIDPTAPPATITITGQHMDPTYAMPQVYFYDQDRTVWLRVTAISASPDGTSIVVPATGVDFPDNYYAAVIYAMKSDGTWGPVGGAAVLVFAPVDPATGGGNCTGRNCLPQG